MSKSFSAKSAFASNKESITAGDYIKKKKKNLCNSLTFNTGDLNINLFTELDLSGVCTVMDMSGNCQPEINMNEPFYLNYVIDPSGQLFGQTTCGVNNFVKYMVISK